MASEKFWRDYGLDREGVAQADAAMALMLEAVRLAGPLAPTVFRAALFEVEELPRRTPEAQASLRWRPEGKP